MRIFVTGASGWIGSAVVPELIGAGHRGRRPGPLGRLGRRADGGGRRGAPRHPRRPRRLARRRGCSGRRHPPGVQARHRVRRRLRRRRRRRPPRHRGLRRGPRRLRSPVRHRGGHARPRRRGGWRPRRTGAAPIRQPSGGGARGSDGQRHGSRSRWHPAAFARSCCDFRRPSMATVTTASSRPRSGSRATRASPGTSARAAIAGPRCTDCDAAHLFRLAVEGAPAGSVLHAVADEGVPVLAIAEVIGRHLGVPTVSIAPEDAGSHFGWLAGFLAADSPASSAATRELLGWHPTQSRTHRGSRRGPLLPALIRTPQCAAWPGELRHRPRGAARPRARPCRVTPTALAVLDAADGYRATRSHVHVTVAVRRRARWPFGGC